jgi:hypothetical protein
VPCSSSIARLGFTVHGMLALDVLLVGGDEEKRWGYKISTGCLWVSEEIVHGTATKVCEVSKWTGFMGCL